MSIDSPQLEPIAEQILAEIRDERIKLLSAKRPSNDLGPVGYIPPDAEVHALSAAVSAKRQADALERIATALELGNGLAMVLADNELEDRPNAYVDNVCSGIAGALK